MADRLAPETPIWIDHLPTHEGPAQLLINLCDDPPPFFARFERLAELIGADGPALDRGRERYRFYSQDLINNLFNHPYTKIDFIRRDLKVSRLTATRYLDELAEGGFVHKQKVGRSNYYINLPLYRILTGAAPPERQG